MKTFSKLAILATTIVSLAVTSHAQSYNGWVDTVNCTTISGWAWDYTNNPVSVDLYDGSIPIATVGANQYRADLVSAGIGNGYHAFSLPTPSNLQNGAIHLIYAYYSGTNVPLNYSGVGGVNCSAPATGYQS